MVLKNSKMVPLYIPFELLVDVEDYQKRYHFTKRNQAILDLIRYALNEKRDKEALLDDVSREYGEEGES